MADIDYMGLRFFKKTLIKDLRNILYFLGSFCLIFLFCQTVLSASFDELRSSLNQELEQLQNQINQYQSKIKDAQNQAKTLKREIQLFNDRIKQIELQIKQTEIVLQQTQLAIDDKTKEIGNQEVKMDREKNLLSQYLQSIHESDQEGLIQIIFSQKNLSDIFNEINSLEIIQKNTYDTINEIKIIKENLEGERQDLSDKKEEELQLKALLEIQRFSIKGQQAERNNLLVQTKGEESAFQNLLKKAKANAAAIRSQIYLLEGVGLSMSLEEAYNHAKFASDLTGVRPAFLLAVLKQESSWGTNVGTGTWRKDMHSRDQDAFIKICDELNFDPDKMPVSRKPSYGWGGAMGPAQFLPTTWLSYKDEVARLTGHNPPSPWNIDDAFTAAALKLARAGASQRSYDAEWKAAMIYFAGNNWSKSVYRFYGDSVMDLAQVIQEQLDLMNKK